MYENVKCVTIYLVYSSYVSPRKGGCLEYELQKNYNIMHMISIMYSEKEVLYTNTHITYVQHKFICMHRSPVVVVSIIRLN